MAFIANQNRNGATTLAKRLTWPGCEFLADARDDATWEKVTAACGDSSFGVVSSILHETALRKARGRM